MPLTPNNSCSSSLLRLSPLCSTQKVWIILRRLHHHLSVRLEKGILIYWAYGWQAACVIPEDENIVIYRANQILHCKHHKRSFINATSAAFSSDQQASPVDFIMQLRLCAKEKRHHTDMHTFVINKATRTQIRPIYNSESCRLWEKVSLEPKPLFGDGKKVEIVYRCSASWISTKDERKMFISRIRIVREGIIKDNNGSSLWNYRIYFQFSQAFLFSLHSRCGCVLLGFIRENKFNPLQGWLLCGLRVESAHNVSSDDAQSTTKTKFHCSQQRDSMDPFAE